MSTALVPLAGGLVDALRPLPGVLQSAPRLRILLGNLGITLQIDVPRVAALAGVAADLEAVIQSADAVLGQQPVDAADVLELVLDALELIETLASLDGAAIAEELAESWAEVALGIPEYLLLRYFEAHTPGLYAVLRFVGVIVQEAERRHLVWSNLTALVADPAAYLQARYGWGRESFDALPLLEALWLFGNGVGLPVELRKLRETIEDAFWSGAAPESARELDIPFHRGLGSHGAVDLGVIVAPVPDGLYLANLTYGTTAAELDLGGGWIASLSAALEASGSAGIRVRPSGVDAPTALPAASVELALEGRPDEPWYLLGDAAGTYARVSGLRHAVRFRKDAEGAAVEVELGTLGGADGASGLELAVTPGEGDSFVSGLLGNFRLNAGLDLNAIWSSRDGLTLGGGAELLITLPVGKSLGPVFLQSVTAGVDTTNGVAFEASLSASVTLGPFVLVFDRVGLELVAQTNGASRDALVRFGPLALDLGFKPPSGVGVACDGGVVSGGGYVYIDRDAGQYSGAVDLDVLGVGVTALGIVSTKLPNAADGWAMILSISSEFPPLQLGFGFTLNGVGGLVAVNRTLSASVLQAGLKDGSLDPLLFPTDVVAQAPALLALLDSAFPIAVGQFTFGPVVKIGWGTPTVMSAELGVIISLPDPVTIALIGQFSAVLPDPDAALIELHLDVLGVVDFGAGTIAVDAMLRDSFVAGLVLSGAMALRSSFLASPSFLLSFGGFHPDFQPPATVPALDRLRVALDLGSALQVSLEAYFAITSNSVQAGARLWAVAEMGKFSAEGGAGFNALIHFAPFHFEADLGYSVEVRYGNTTLMGVHLALDFSGPKPWHGVGTATFTILGFDVDFRVEGTIGGGSSQPSIAPVDVLRAHLVPALKLDAAWAALAPDATEVTLRETAEGELWAHPDGALEVRQHLVPLEQQLDSFGNAPITGAKSFAITAPKIGGVAATDATDLLDWFAPAQFLALTTAQKLSRPSFEQMVAGVAFGAALAKAGRAASAPLTYETFFVDPEAAAEAKPKTAALSAEQLSAATLSSLSAGAAAQRATARARVPSSVTVAPTRWVVASTQTLHRAPSVLQRAASFSEARSALDAWLLARPADRTLYQIVPEAEVA